MKKGISVLIIIFMLLVSINTVNAADDILDIEKVAIHSVKNSQDVQSMNRRVTEAQRIKADMASITNAMRGSLQYQSSYQTVLSVILLPVQSENGLTQATNMQSVLTNAVRLSAYNRYIDLLKEEYALNIQHSLMNGFDTDYKKAQLQHKLGMISQSELRLSEITYRKAQYRFDSAQKGWNSASMAVNNMMGEELSKRYSKFQDYNITPAAQIKPLNDYVNLALANRADVINAQGTLDLKKKEYELGKAAIPTDYHFYIQQQEHGIDRAQNDLDLAKINVQLDITNLYTGLGSAMKNLEAMKDLYDQAELNYQASELKYKNGQISLQALNDAKVVKAQADITYKNAEIDAWFMQTTMDSACGIGYQPSR